MLRILLHPIYRRLFAAQVIALIGTGLLTVALGLLAFDLAGAGAGAVLGTALAIKMIAYVLLAPIANAAVERLPRKVILISADLVRAAIALFLPFIDAIWQIYGLIFVLQAASATFTPTFQAMIPEILEDEADYTKALSLSRLAYDLENLMSPALAAVLLVLISYHWLFAGTVAGFIVSALLVWTTDLPARMPTSMESSFWDRLTRGARIYVATPRLKGLLALNMTAAASAGFIIVNTVVIVRTGYAGSETDVAMALAAFGAGSMASALALPRILDRVSDRSVMVVSGALLAGLTMAVALWWMSHGLPGWSALLVAWAATGIFYSATLTPSGRLLRRSAHASDRPAVFAAQFALSHACWLITYPVAGRVGEALGLPVAMLLLGLLAVAGVVAALLLWPASDPSELTHDHANLPTDHPHLREHGRVRHRHVFVIDELHRVWRGAMD